MIVELLVSAAGKGEPLLMSKKMKAKKSHRDGYWRKLPPRAKNGQFKKRK